MCAWAALLLCFMLLTVYFDGTPSRVVAWEVVQSPFTAVVPEARYHVETMFDGHDGGSVSISSISAAPGRGFFYALDSHKHQLLKIIMPSSTGGRVVVDHVAGSVNGEPGYHDGVGKNASFNHPQGLAVDYDGNVYVADVRNCVLRKVTPSGVVSTIAGKVNKTGRADGDGDKALFSNNFDVAYLPRTCAIVISDQGNQAVRIITLKSQNECSNSSENYTGFQRGLAFAWICVVLCVIALIVRTFLWPRVGPLYYNQEFHSLVNINPGEQLLLQYSDGSACQSLPVDNAHSTNGDLEAALIDLHDDAMSEIGENSSSSKYSFVNPDNVDARNDDKENTPSSSGETEEVPGMVETGSTADNSIKTLRQTTSQIDQHIFGQLESFCRSHM